MVDIIDVTDGTVVDDMDNAQTNFENIATAIADLTVFATTGYPDQTDASGKVLSTDGTTPEWIDFEIENDTSPTLGGDLDGGGYVIYNSPIKTQNIGSVAANQTLDAAVYNYFRIEPTADITLDIANLSTGSGVIIELLGAGDHTLTWEAESVGSTVVWIGDTEPCWATGTDSNITALISPDGSTLAELGTVKVSI